jgi:hypothetical protein
MITLKGIVSRDWGGMLWTDNWLDKKFVVFLDHIIDHFVIYPMKTVAAIHNLMGIYL